MARSLSQSLTLTRYHLSPLSSSAGGLISHRLRSTLPEAAEESEKERIALKKLEDAIHRIIVKRSEPDWLPFVPGSSYWVPPKSKSRGVAQVIGKLLSSSSSSSSSTTMSKDQALNLTYDRGWPSSPYFFEGASNPPLEGETPAKLAPQSEEEEG